MKYICNNSINPYFNIAFEEYCLENIEADEDYFIIWQNSPSIILGSHQNVFQEINPYFVNENNIPIVRRISGGGTVYHDLGNVNFTFIFNSNEGKNINYVEHNKKIMEVLFSLGLETSMSKRNDILYSGKKISGNAQRVYKNRVLHHGTILFDADLNNLIKSLHVSMQSINSKAIQSIRSKVINIKDELDKKMTVEEFKEYFISYLSNNYSDSEILLTEKDENNIIKNVNNKFISWEWNYGESPPFSFENTISSKGYLWRVNLKVKDGLIFKCEIIKDGKLYNHKLVGVRYGPEYLFDLINFLDKDDVFNLFFGNNNVE